MILLLPDTRQARAFRRLFADLLATDFPVFGTGARQLLAAGADPGGSAVVVITAVDMRASPDYPYANIRQTLNGQSK